MTVEEVRRMMSIVGQVKEESPVSMPRKIVVEIKNGLLIRKDGLPS